MFAAAGRARDPAWCRALQGKIASQSRASVRCVAPPFPSHPFHLRTTQPNTDFMFAVTFFIAGARSALPAASHLQDLLPLAASRGSAQASRWRSPATPARSGQQPLKAPHSCFILLHSKVFAGWQHISSAPVLIMLPCTDLVMDAINKCDVDVRKDLYQGVILTGGVAGTGGLRDRLERELSERGPQVSAAGQVAGGKGGVWAQACCFTCRDLVYAHGFSHLYCRMCGSRWRCQHTR